MLQPLLAFFRFLTANFGTRQGTSKAMQIDRLNRIYEHGNFTFKSGATIPNARTAYRTYGSSENPAVIISTAFGGTLKHQDYLVGDQKALDTRKYFVISFALFGNGESSSPSNTPSPFNGIKFPEISYEDNVKAHYEVLTKELGVKHVHAVFGFSMAAQLAYHWPVMYPNFINKFIVLCGSARTSYHNYCFLEGPKNALTASKDYLDGKYTSHPTHGLRATARAYSSWPYSHEWFRQEKFKMGGQFDSLPSYLSNFEAWFDDWDANDVHWLLKLWQSGDISKIKDDGNLEKTLSDIKNEGLIMPSRTDMYFPPEDNELEVARMSNAKLVVIDTIWGHVAGGGANPDDIEFIQKEVSSFLEGGGYRSDPVHFKI